MTMLYSIISSLVLLLWLGLKVLKLVVVRVRLLDTKWVWRLEDCRGGNYTIKKIYHYTRTFSDNHLPERTLEAYANCNQLD